MMATLQDVATGPENVWLAEPNIQLVIPGWCEAPNPESDEFATRTAVWIPGSREDARPGMTTPE
jgi:hypothetical protein